MTAEEPRWALVTGGSRGIGRAVAGDLARRGWNVALAHLRNTEAAREVAEDVRRQGCEVFVFEGNLARSEECAELIDRLEQGAIRLDGFVHCAALGALSPALETRPSRWEMAWKTHVGALLELVKLARAVFRPRASVVALTSLGARRVMPGYASLGAVKGALESLVRYLAAELAESGVNVNAVCAGPVDTDSMRSFSFYEELDRQCRLRPCGRMGLPEDVAPVIAFLLGPEAQWIRGQVVVVDGGFSLY